jgi:2-polyprenyl-3-methyl-5-hydroxy-6-metoxy-1,4-benzoquinol methylase
MVVPRPGHPALIVGETVLDVGCGLGRWGALIETNYWEAGLPAPPRVDGLDAFAANVEHCRARGAYRRVWQQTLPSPLEDSWDTVLACEFIEHVPEEAVETVLDSLEGAARRRIIVSTPNSPLLRPGSETIVGFNPYEAHVSYVSRDLLHRRGYRIRGVGFGRYNSRLARIAKRFGVRNTLTTLPRAFPAIAESIVAVRDVG